MWVDLRFKVLQNVIYWSYCIDNLNAMKKKKKKKRNCNKYKKPVLPLNKYICMDIEGQTPGKI